MSTRFKKAIARGFLRLTGWTAEGARPAEHKFVLIAAPHTSNWDLAYLLAFAVIFDIQVSWMGKHQLFRQPLGFFMRQLGGIPVVRDRSRDMVSQMVAAFAERESLALVVPAEGTRSYVSHWKSGFYYISRGAKVPVVLSFLDYQRRIGGFGPALELTGDVRRDMDEIREFYADIAGKYPDLVGEVLLKEEQ